MRQMSFSELEYEPKKKVTRRDRFLDELERVMSQICKSCYSNRARND